MCFAVSDAMIGVDKFILGSEALAVPIWWVYATSLHFVAPQAIEDGLADRIAVNRRLAAVGNVRGIGKAQMPRNDATPDIEVDPDTFTVRIDGEVWQEQPAAELPMAQRYFLF
ncbi:hypothetical protein ASJ79_25950 [Mycobacterium sp. NAZ190054]|nr:hypothetical protein ASJ79_25950 [Mycobacterium sp. NAZ190054]